MTIAPPTPAQRRRRRPFGVGVIALLQGIASPLSGISWVLAESPFGLSRAYEAVSGLFVYAFGLLGIAIAVGLWRLQRWAWTATMLWFGCTMAGALLAYRRGEPPYPLMVISLLTVFYLNQRDVQHAFGMGTPPAPAVDAAPEVTPELAPVRKGTA